MFAMSGGVRVQAGIRTGDLGQNLQAPDSLRLKANNVDSKYSLIENFTTMYGKGAGEILMKLLYAVNYFDSTKFKLKANSNNSKYDIVQNLGLYYGRDSGEVNAALVYLLNAPPDVTAELVLLAALIDSLRDAAIDTLSLSNRIDAKLNKADTASLSSRIDAKLAKADTLSLSNRIDTKLNKADTAALSSRIDAKLNKADTLSLSNRIDAISAKALDPADFTGKYIYSTGTEFIPATTADVEGYKELAVFFNITEEADTVSDVRILKNTLGVPDSTIYISVYCQNVFLWHGIVPGEYYVTGSMCSTQFEGVILGTLAFIPSGLTMKSSDWEVVGKEKDMFWGIAPDGSTPTTLVGAGSYAFVNVKYYLK